MLSSIEEDGFNLSLDAIHIIVNEIDLKIYKDSAIYNNSLNLGIYVIQ